MSHPLGHSPPRDMVEALGALKQMIPRDLVTYAPDGTFVLLNIEKAEIRYWADVGQFILLVPPEGYQE